MKYEVLYIASPLEAWEVTQDTTPLMIAEVRRRGGKTWVAEPGGISLDRDGGFIFCRMIDTGDGDGPLTVGDVIRRRLDEFTVIHLRTDPPFDLDYYYTTLLLGQLRGPLVVNHPGWVRTLNEKIAILNFPQFITDTLVTGDAEEAADFISSVGDDAIAKDLGSCSSRGIVRLQGQREDVVGRFLELRQQWQGPIMLQRFLRAVHAGETRVTLIDGQPLGWMKKVPREDSFLASLDFGATVSACDPTPRDQELAAVVGKFLRQRGIIFAALDVIDGHLSEINVTSPGLLRHTNAVMNCRLEEKLEDTVEKIRAQGGWQLSVV